MTTRGDPPAVVRLAWGIGLCSLGLLIGSAILVVLDARAIDSPLTAPTLFFLVATIVGVLGVLIATRRPRNPIGWLLLAIAFAEPLYLRADFAATRGLLSSASPRG